MSEAFIREKLETLPDIKKEVHVWEKKYQVNYNILGVIIKTNIKKFLRL